MSTFALVHGGLHGGWCWELVVPILEAQGHTVIAPDLPIGDDQAGALRWAEVIAEASGGHDDVVAVGHSMGGMALPVLASIRPIRRMVFLGAMVPVPGLVYAEYLATQPDAVIVDATPDSAGMPSYAVIRDYFYNDCDEDVVRAAYTRLRPQSMTVFTEPCPIETWPAVPSTYILMTDDRCVGNDWSRRVATERLGGPAIELAASHSPFYSRPKELAGILEEL